eukprot:355097-Chlamydomonas_euryale.AAC.4
MVEADSAATAVVGDLTNRVSGERCARAARQGVRCEVMTGGAGQGVWWSGSSTDALGLEGGEREVHTLTGLEGGERELFT